MTIGFMKRTNVDRLVVNHGLQYVMGNYYYLPIDGTDDCNFLFIVRGVTKDRKTDNKIEPVEFMQMLIQLSPRVRINNTFGDVAICLRLPDRLRRRARKLDEGIADFCLGITHKG